MPTTLSSIVIFAAFLVPGFVYLARTESRLPGIEMSALRETASVVSVSVLTNLVALSVFGLARIFWPGLLPDVGNLVTDPARHFRERYLELTVWGTVLLGVSVCIAAVLAVPPRRVEVIAWKLKRSSDAPVSRWIRRRRNLAPIRPESAWSSAFNAASDDDARFVYLGLRLKDGAYVSGALDSFSTQVDESDDRAITLSEPVLMRTKNCLEPVDLGVARFLVAASEIKTISVWYLHLPDDESSIASGKEKE